MVRFDENNNVVQETNPRVILVGLELKEDIEKSMAELKALAEADGCQVIGQMVQRLERPNNATFIGKGKLEELAQMIENMDGEMVIFNDEMSGIQLRNISDALDVQVLDRTGLILDIFATRALSKEGRLQVEYAQLKYRFSRLIGLGKSLSRQGGIGNRGPGEKKLELDRRHIARRMEEIKSKLKDLDQVRNLHRQRREKVGIPVVALVGYTNVGKSALMNRLLDEFKRDAVKEGEDLEEGDLKVLEKDMLFATLDTHARKISLSKNQSFILMDTVGFVSKLPHDLVDAFKSTLEQVEYADLILHVVDAHDDETDFQIDVTNKVLKDLHAQGKEKLMVYNKIDLAGEKPWNEERSIGISAKYGLGIDSLVLRIKKAIFSEQREVEFLFPYEKGGDLSRLCGEAETRGVEYLPEGTLVKALVREEQEGRYKNYIRK